MEQEGKDEERTQDSGYHVKDGHSIARRYWAWSIRHRVRYSKQHGGITRSRRYNY